MVRAAAGVATCECGIVSFGRAGGGLATSLTRSTATVVEGLKARIAERGRESRHADLLRHACTSVGATNNSWMTRNAAPTTMLAASNSRGVSWKTANATAWTAAA